MPGSASGTGNRNEHGRARPLGIHNPCGKIKTGQIGKAAICDDFERLWDS